MSLLLLGDEYDSASSDSGSESGSESAKIGGDGSQRRVSDQKSPPPSSVADLPCAESALAAASVTTASFLAPQRTRSTGAAAAEFDLFEADARVATTAANADDSRKRRASALSPPTTKRERTAANAAPPQQQQQQQQQRRQQQPSTKRENANAKERVKAQRGKGQAGIGSDFRAWKSETEMAMRQQFD